MSVDYNDVVKEADVKVKGRRLGLWKSKRLILRLPSSRGPSRLEKVSKSSAEQESTNAVLLTSASGAFKSTTSANKQLVEIHFTNRSAFQFYVESEEESESWCNEITFVLQRTPLPTGSFHVYLLPNPNLTVHGECILQVTKQDLHVFDVIDKSEIVRWPLVALRRYGRHLSTFTIESGRSCNTGEGIFVFNSHASENLYASVHRASHAIATAYSIATNLERNAATPVVRLNRPLSSDDSPLFTHNNNDNDGTTQRSAVTLPRLGSNATPFRRPLPPVPGM